MVLGNRAQSRPSDGAGQHKQNRQPDLHPGASPAAMRAGINTGANGGSGESAMPMGLAGPPARIQSAPRSTPGAGAALSANDMKTR